MTEPNIRVLTVFPSAVGGGAEQLLLDHMRLYDRASVEHRFVSLRRGPLDETFGKHPEFGCLAAGLPFSLRALRQLHKLVQEHRIQVLHTHLQEADIYGFFIKRQNPTLVWISSRHNTDRFRKRLFWRWLNHRISRDLTRVIAVSESVRRFISRNEGISRERIKVIRNGVDSERFLLAESRSTARRRFGIKDSAFVVGIVGRLVRQKGHRDLLLAASWLVRDIPELQVIIVGCGKREPSLRRLVRRLRIAAHVAFLGQQADMPAVYCAMDALCLPSLYEGFGLVIVEAMLSKVPVVATRVDGIREIVDDEETGLLVEPRRPAEIVHALARVYRGDLPRNMLQRAQAAARDKFDITRQVRALEATYCAELLALTGDVCR